MKDNVITQHSKGKNRGTLSVLHVRIGDKLRDLVTERSKDLGLSISAYVRMVLSQREHAEIRREVK